MYRIDAQDEVTVDNLRRKYVYMLGSIMGSHNIWHGGSLAEVHQGVKKTIKLPKFKVPGQPRKLNKKISKTQVVP